MQHILGHSAQKEFAKLCEAAISSELVELAATGGCGGRGDLQCLKGLEKLMDNRSSRGTGRNVPSNILNPMITDARGIRREKAAERGWTPTLLLENNFWGQLKTPRLDE